MPLARHEQTLSRTLPASQTQQGGTQQVNAFACAGRQPHRLLVGMRSQANQINLVPHAQHRRAGRQSPGNHLVQRFCRGSYRYSNWLATLISKDLPIARAFCEPSRTCQLTPSMRKRSPPVSC